MGKKIVSLNAVKHGMYSCPLIETMAALRDNPIQYIKLVTELINSFHPRNPAEMTMLHLQRDRRRAEAEMGEVERDPASLGLPSRRADRAPDPRSDQRLYPEDGGKVGL